MRLERPVQGSGVKTQGRDQEGKPKAWYQKSRTPEFEDIEDIEMGGEFFQ